MSNSLRDALLQSGVKPPRKARGGGPKANRGNKAAKRRTSTPREDEELDLAKAWSLRQQSEARERAEAKRKAEEKKARRKRLRQLLEGQGLDTAEAEQVRHYEFHGKIRRVHVTAEQLRALNDGELAVVQLRGRFMLVTAELARKAAAIEPGCLALLVEPGADGMADDGVPDDLMW